MDRTRRLDKSQIRKGMFLTGGNCPSDRTVSPSYFQRQQRADEALCKRYPEMSETITASHGRLDDIKSRSDDIVRRLANVKAGLEAYSKARK